MSEIKGDSQDPPEKIYELYEELKDYTYVTILDINNIPLKSHIKYVNKSTLKKKNGFLNKIKEDILELCTQNKKRKWHIYVEENYIFYGEYQRKNKLKDQLLKLLQSDFAELKTKTSVN